ncbi:MAG: energy-coupling factor transporter ATPase [Firmicutes bacterium]|nr:energy-coupling factor transporter ATPase [Bacillota bacterium]
MIETMIEFKGVSYSYSKTEDKITALNNIDLTIKEGEFIAILGPNGSGKSTLAKHINGLLIPKKGEVLVDGLSTRDTSSLWQIRQRVGMVFQNLDNQIIATSVEEDVAFGPENLGLGPKEIRKRIDEALEIVGMRAYAKHEPHLLSGGQKQKIAIAGALAMYPKYLVIDEATSMLDPKGRADTLVTLKALNKEHGTTVINITHSPDEAVQADRIVVLSDGAIIKTGVPKEVFVDSSELAALGIGVPKAKLIADELVSAGLSLPTGILTVGELVSALC